MLNTAVKRGRGRPRKTETTKFTAKKTVKKTAKKRGRPLGSKNKAKQSPLEERLARLELSVYILSEMIKLVKI